jgi:hypothetical protein
MGLARCQSHMAVSSLANTLTLARGLSWYAESPGRTVGNTILLVSYQLNQSEAAEYCDAFFRVAPQDRLPHRRTAVAG